MTETRRPLMVFFPGKELCDDASNWWGPNPAAVEALLRDVGFRRIETMSQTLHGSSAPVRLARAAFNRLVRRRPFFETQGWGRVVLHAWK